MHASLPSGNAFVTRFVMEPKTQNIWGANHATWFFLMGIAGALFLNRALFGVELGRVLGMPLADVLGLVLVGIGGLILIADLGKPLRFLRAVVNVKQSWISVGAICDFIFMVFGGLYVLPALTLGSSRPFAWLPTGEGTLLSGLFQLIAGLAAVVVVVYPGFVMAKPTAIPFWNTTLVPMHFLAFAYAGGTALAFATGPLASAEDQAFAQRVVPVAVVVTLFLVVAHVAEAYYRRRTARESARELVSGRLRGHFLGGVVLLGLVAPAVLTLSAPAIGGGALLLAAVLLQVGNWLSKYTVLKAGKYAPY
jgi:formate-dependent nitrite reductase membrane component NrfD